MRREGLYVWAPIEMFVGIWAVSNAGPVKSAGWRGLDAAEAYIYIYIYKPKLYQTYII
jgi:hypothetical protein